MTCEIVRCAGTVIPTRCGDVEIIQYTNNERVLFRFLETGTIAQSAWCNLIKGRVRDVYRRTIFGTGYFGKGDYKSRSKGIKGKLPPYACWENMMARCYYPKTDRFSAYGGSGVTVCDEWHNFQVFGEWFDKNHVVGQALDKDILNRGSLEYSPENCCFVPQAINGLLVNSQRDRKKSNLPTGVRAEGKKYASYMNRRGVNYKLGSFNTIQEASEIYTESRKDYLASMAEEYYKKGDISVEVRDSLLAWFD